MILALGPAKRAERVPVPLGGGWCMQAHSNWSIGLGRWGGVHVRLHMFFLLFAVFTLYLSWISRQETGSSDLIWTAAGSVSILLASVMLHELGHYAAAIRLGGSGDEIVIGPLGGLAPMRAPQEPPAEFMMHLAGPLVNLLVCLICAMTLLALQDPNLPGLLNPLAPQYLVEGTGWRVALKLTFWINWLLLLANLLPAFPFDGGRALRAALSSFLPAEHARHSPAIVAGLAKVAAVALVIAAWLLRANDSERLVPLWFSLVLLAIFLYFGAKQEQDRTLDSQGDEQLFGYDFSQGYTSLERSSAGHEVAAGAIARWLERRRRTRFQRQQELEVEEERRVDEVLARLHEKGIDSLSHEDRSLLKRVSARYRHRNSEQK